MHPADRDVLQQLIKSLPDWLVEPVDNQLTDHKANASDKRLHQQAARFARDVRIPSRWYAIDGTRMFYLFDRKSLTFSTGWTAFDRQPVDAGSGTPAEKAYYSHGGRLTDKRPSGWVSRATLITAMTSGSRGRTPAAHSPHYIEEIDYDPVTAERLHRECYGTDPKNPGRDFPSIVWTW